jgi:hypothetical protein
MHIPHPSIHPGLNISDRRHISVLLQHIATIAYYVHCVIVSRVSKNASKHSQKYKKVIVLSAENSIILSAVLLVTKLYHDS